MSMSKLGHHGADLAEIAARYHRARVPHERVAGIAVVDRTDPAAGARRAYELLGFINGRRERLLAQYIEPRIEKCMGDLEVGGVRGRYCHQGQPVRARPLCLEHLAPVAIGALASDAEAQRERAAARGIRIERRSTKLECSIHRCADAVSRTDLAPLTAAD